MLQLKGLQDQLETLRVVFDEAISSGKTLGEVKGIWLQIKQVEKLIYERKVMLKREGKYVQE